MKQQNNIFRFLRTIFMVFALVFVLGGCGSDSSNGNVSVIELSDNPDEQNELDEQQRACWQAELLSSFYNVMAESSVKAYPHVTGSAMPFMMVAFAVWLSFQILKHVGSVVEESPGVIWTDIGRMAFLCLTCGLLASSTTFLLYVLNKLIFPIYYAFLEYGSLVLNTMTTSAEADAPGIYLGEPEKGVCLIYSNSLVCSAPPIENVTLSSFPSGPSDLMQCLACAVNDRMQLGFVLAKNLMGMFTLSSVICGLLLYVVFAIVKISFVFYMVDSIFRMNIMVILLPCFIMAYPFKYTRKWVKQGLLIVLNSAAILAFIAIVIALALMAMQILLVDNSALIGNRDSYREFGAPALIVLLVAFLVLKSIGLAVSLASSVVGGGGGTDFQKKIASLAAQIAKGAFIWVTGGVGKVFTQTRIGQALEQKRNDAKNKINELAGRK